MHRTASLRHPILKNKRGERDLRPEDLRKGSEGTRRKHIKKKKKASRAEGRCGGGGGGLEEEEEEEKE